MPKIKPVAGNIIAMPYCCADSSNLCWSIKGSKVATKGMGLFFASPLYLQRELEQGLLVPVLPNLQGQEMELWGFYPNKKYLPIKTRLLLDFLKTKLASPLLVST